MKPLLAVFSAVLLPGGAADAQAQVTAAAGERFTLTMASADEVEKAHRGLSGIYSLEVKPIDDGAFLFADLDRDWWEIRA